MRLPSATTQNCHTNQRASYRKTEDKGNPSGSALRCQLQRSHTKRDSCKRLSSLAACARSSPREDGLVERNFAMLNKQPATDDEIAILRGNINSGPVEPPQLHNIVVDAQPNHTVQAQTIFFMRTIVVTVCSYSANWKTAVTGRCVCMPVSPTSPTSQSMCLLIRFGSTTSILLPGPACT